jgi:hypothetical protein
MSAVVKLSSKMPGDPEINGLDAMVTDLLTDPEEIIVGVVYLDVAKIQRDIDSGDEIPTVRVRRIEPLGSIHDVSQAVRDAVAEAEAERTGRTPIPFEIVEVGEHAHSDTLDGA